MTISIEEYLSSKQPVRKKEPQYIAVINKNSCTSCNSCASMCPVDCIYEKDNGPGQSYHVIDQSRCIGCQMCYRVPSESTGPWQMEICPWNAIDLIHNPNYSAPKQKELKIEPYFAGEGTPPNFRKLEELGYTLFLNRLLYAAPGSVTAKDVEPFTQPVWSWGEGNFAILSQPKQEGPYNKYVCTSEGYDLVDYLYRDYPYMFLD